MPHTSNYKVLIVTLNLKFLNKHEAHCGLTAVYCVGFLQIQLCSHQTWSYLLKRPTNLNQKKKKDLYAREVPNFPQSKTKLQIYVKFFGNYDSRFFT